LNKSFLYFQRKNCLLSHFTRPTIGGRNKIFVQKRPCKSNVFSGTYLYNKLDLWNISSVCSILNRFICHAELDIFSLTQLTHHFKHSVLFSLSFSGWKIEVNLDTGICAIRCAHHRQRVFTKDYKKQR